MVAEALAAAVAEVVKACIEREVPTTEDVRTFDA